MVRRFVNPVGGSGRGYARIVGQMIEQSLSDVAATYIHPPAAVIEGVDSHFIRIEGLDIDAGERSTLTL